MCYLRGDATPLDHPLFSAFRKAPSQGRKTSRDRSEPAARSHSGSAVFSAALGSCRAPNPLPEPLRRGTVPPPARFGRTQSGAASHTAPLTALRISRAGPEEEKANEERRRRIQPPGDSPALPSPPSGSTRTRRAAPRGGERAGAAQGLRRPGTPLRAGAVGPAGRWGAAGCCRRCCCCWVPRGRCCGRRSRRSRQIPSAPSGAWRGAPGWTRGSLCPCGTSTSRRSARPDGTSPAPRQVPFVCSGPGGARSGRPAPGCGFAAEPGWRCPPVPLFPFSLLPSFLSSFRAVAVPSLFPGCPGHAGWQAKSHGQTLLSLGPLLSPVVYSKLYGIYTKESVSSERTRAPGASGRKIPVDTWEVVT